MYNYPKIDLYVDGKYTCSTTWVKTCRVARERFCQSHDVALSRVKARFAEPKARRGCKAIKMGLLTEEREVYNSGRW